ncbi:TPA: hypothetical protein MNC23_004585 [Citrobacter freundii]|uniref:HTH Mu-type domain-containing protein n=1 Tax=Citrobacter freundii TaxID=546 RepID=A0AAP9QEW7_CITFR|nr:MULTISPECIES: DNA-binding protein [Enterobacteriaceae]ECD5889609.1 hypothetical protein [Salmonella enterica subsp. enterica serovar Agona]EGG0282451.1 hypothetical protein [Salmonella enterica]DAO72774.1 MAG TPA: Mu DNA-binding domain [Caudoviricetes sp.]AYL56270.1 hypothetical protein CUC48_06600 [Citrobacter freundii]EHM1247306.1 hypothetical protein [Salmonella enterica]
MPHSNEQKEWVTAKEVAGLPDMPTTARRARDILDRATLEQPGLRRKRQGTKATEYHVSVLPERTRHHFGNSDSELSCSDARVAVHQPTLGTDEDKALWMMIYNRMTKEQRDEVMNAFIRGGLNALMPKNSAVDIPNNKEISEQCDSDEQVESAPKLSTQSKAG